MQSLSYPEMTTATATRTYRRRIRPVPQTTHVPMTQSPAAVRVLIVYEPGIVGDALTTMLRNAPGIAVTGCAKSPYEALRTLYTCDVVLVSASLPDSKALKLCGSVKDADPRKKVIVIADADTEAAMLRYFEAGADGFVHETSTAAALIEQITAVHRSEVVLSRKMAGLMVARLAQLAQLCGGARADVTLLETLTGRERQVLQLVKDGRANKDIARDLDIAVGTVKNHVHNILDKLNVARRKDAAMLLTIAERKRDIDGEGAQPDRPLVRRTA